MATRDELYVRGRVVERRLTHGVASFENDVIDASDERDDQLVDLCDLESLRAAMPRDAARVRLVADARVENDVLTTSSTLTISSSIGLSVVTTPEHAAKDHALLLSLAPLRGERVAEGRVRGLPLVWRNGTASVLLHEAIGHAVEQQASPLPVWRSWLKVDIAFGLRRATFRDVPMLRMKELVATQTDAPFELEDKRIEVLLVGGGAYEALTETITVRIAAADLVDGDKRERLAPFDVVQTRGAIAHGIIGAEGDPQRYPGVICSREGQELVVGSYAPTIVTRFA